MDFSHTISSSYVVSTKNLSLARVFSNDLHFVCHFWQLYLSVVEILIGILLCSQSSDELEQDQSDKADVPQSEGITRQHVQMYAVLLNPLTGAVMEAIDDQ